MRSAIEIYTEIYIYILKYIYETKLQLSLVNRKYDDLEPIIRAKVPIIFLFY